MAYRSVGCSKGIAPGDWSLKTSKKNKERGGNETIPASTCSPTRKMSRKFPNFTTRGITFALPYFSCHVFCTGPIPKELGAVSKLVQLRLHDNGLTGEEPKKSRSGFNKMNPAHAWARHMHVFGKIK